MKTIPANLQTKLDTALGTEPVIVVYITWAGEGTSYYADKDVSGVFGAHGDILNFTPLSTSSRNSGISQIISARLVLDDSDGSLKTKYNKVDFEQARCIVYQYFDGLALADKLVLLQGKIAPDIVWDEGERTFAFDIETIIEDEQVGYAPIDGDITNLHDDAIGVPFPLCFGVVRKVPAVRIRKPTKGTTKEQLTINSSTIKIDNGYNFPQGTSIDIIIDTILCTGSFSNDVFTFTEINKAFYSGEAFAARVADADEHNAAVAWLDDSTINLVGKFVLVDHDTYGDMVNFCIKQDGAKCYFAKPWRPDSGDTDVELDNSDEIEEACGEVHTDWPVSYKIDTTYYHIDDSGDWYLQYFYSHGQYVQDSWLVDTGVKVIEVTSYDDMYVCNLIASTSIIEVLGYRKNKEGEKVLAPIPSSYYSKTLSNSSVKTGLTITTLEFAQSLEERFGEDWEGDIFVTVESSMGYNTATIIEYLLDTYSSLDTDETTFTACETYLLNYPSCFALLDQHNVLDICEQIAWQARCALVVRNEVVYIRYLSTIYNWETDVIGPEHIKFKSMQLTTKSIEDLITRFVAKWRENYIDEHRQVIYKSNTDIYGTREQEYDFFIYNIESLVELSANFWGYRYANMWRRIRMQFFIEKLAIELYDKLQMRIPQMSTIELEALVDTLYYDSANLLIRTEAEIASKVGVYSADDQPTQDSDYWLGDPANPILYPNPAPSVDNTNLEEDYIVDKNFDYNYSHGSVDSGQYGSSPIIVIDKFTTSVDMDTDLRPPDYIDGIVKIANQATAKVLNNVSGIQIPAFSTVEIDDAAGTHGVIDVKRPTSNSLSPSKIMFTGANPIAVGGKGLGYSPFSFDPKNTCDGTPSVGDSMGTQEDSFKLKNDQTGLMCQGLDGTEAIVKPDKAATFSSQCRAYVSTSYTFSSTGWHAYHFNATSYDGLSEFDTTNYKFVAQATGRYHITAQIVIKIDDGNAGIPIRNLHILVNGSAVCSQYHYEIIRDAAADNWYTVIIEDKIDLTAADEVTIESNISDYDAGDTVMGGASTQKWSLMTIQRIN